jgi:ABC-type multidrug transport system fused ATPase/permease subunit
MSSPKPVTLAFKGITYTVLSNKPKPKPQKPSESDQTPNSVAGSVTDIEEGSNAAPANTSGGFSLFGNNKKEKVCILNSISAKVEPGEVLAIMGPSGKHLFLISFFQHIPPATHTAPARQITYFFFCALFFLKPN